MSEPAVRSSKHVLDPVDHVSEVLFGLIMVLTFTGSLSVAEAGREDIRAMLIGALGCNLAWGIIDGILYLMGCLAEKGRSLATLRGRAHRRRSGRGAPPHRGRAAVGDRVRPATRGARGRAPAAEAVAGAARPRRLERARIGREARAVFLLVFVSTLPVVIPFVVMRNAVPALRVSNGIAIAMLFVAGYVYGRSVGRHAWMLGISMVLLGALLSALAMALGG